MEWEVSIIDFRDRGRLAEFENRDVFELDNVEIKNHQTYERIYVKARFCKDGEKLPNGDILWVRNYNEDLMPQPVKIEILAKLPTGYDDYF